jgi:hypothetical protein
MPDNNNYDKSADRRKYPRSSVYSFLHATATLSDPASSGRTSLQQKGHLLTGLLVDLSCEGAQIILPGDSEKYLSEQQDVAMRIKTTLIETDINLTARVKDITSAGFSDAVRIGVQFTGLENNPDARDAIKKIYEYGEKLKNISASQESESSQLI